MDLQLNGRVALVTGGSQGIGKAVAATLAQEGASVVIAARGAELLGKVAAEIRGAGVPVEQMYEAMGKEIPLGRVGRAEEVASVVAFLASEAARYVTGSSINLDGGASAVM